MGKPKELFVVWQDGEDEQYYNQYLSLEDAVSSEEKGAEIYKADLKSLGSFELIVKSTLKKIKKGANNGKTA